MPIKKCIYGLAAALTAILVSAPGVSFAAQPEAPRARDLGIPFDGQTGPLNAITDVAGVEVGHRTIIEGDSIRTGVSAIFPLGKGDPRGVRAAMATINGTGEVTGAHMIEELGLMFGPILLTTTWSVGTVRDGYLAWVKQNLPEQLWVLYSLPVVAETLDDGLNDAFGMHVTRQHTIEALNAATGGPVSEGNVGGGTGMQAYGFKGGIGTASRQLRLGEDTYTIGVLVQSNHGTRENLRIAGLPVGEELTATGTPGTDESNGKNSLIIVMATDLPLRPDQLERLARRGALGLGRTGAVATTASGEFVIAFSTAGATDFEDRQALSHVSFTAFSDMDAIFNAAVQAVEEALINQLVASEDMSGSGLTVRALPHDDIRRLFAD